MEPLDVLGPIGLFAGAGAFVATWRAISKWPPIGPSRTHPGPPSKGEGSGEAVKAPVERESKTSDERSAGGSAGG
jgi:hypothetical protein